MHTFLAYRLVHCPAFGNLGKGTKDAATRNNLCRVSSEMYDAHRKRRGMPPDDLPLVLIFPASSCLFFPETFRNRLFR